MSKSHQVFLSVNDGYGPIRIHFSNVPCTDPSGTVFRSEEGVLVFTAVHGFIATVLADFRGVSVISPGNAGAADYNLT